jgi:hypothetical protein
MPREVWAYYQATAGAVVVKMPVFSRDVLLKDWALNAGGSVTGFLMTVPANQPEITSGGQLGSVLAIYSTGSTFSTTARQILEILLTAGTQLYVSVNLAAYILVSYEYL